MDPVDPTAFVPLLEAAIREDIGRGDITSEMAIDSSALGTGRFVAKQELVVSGIAIVGEVVRLVDSRLELNAYTTDGDLVGSGTQLASLQGTARSILAAERTALNLLQRMAGIATVTRQYVAAVDGTKASILDTRKTAPGLRLLDKYAVSCGGGVNHRMGLFDSVLIKNNHLAFHPDIGSAIRHVRSHLDEGIPIEIEVRDLAELSLVLTEEVEIILLDNFSAEEARRAVRMIDGRALVEASGGITLENVRDFAEAGVDRISVGALTHSVSAVDVHLQLTPL